MSEIQEKQKAVMPFKRNLSIVVIGITFALNVFVVSILSFSLVQSRAKYEEGAETTTKNISRILDEYLTGVVKTVDVALFALVNEYHRQTDHGGLDERSLNDYIMREKSALPYMDSLRIADARGIIRYGTGVVSGSNISISDRDYFGYLFAHPEAVIAVSKPMIGRISGKPVIILAKRITGPDQSFQGVAYGALTLDYLNKVFSALNVGTDGVISLRDSDFGLIARFPEAKVSGVTLGTTGVSAELRQLVKDGKTEGTYNTPTGSDNIARRVSFRRTKDYPFYIIVGLADKDYLAGWAKEAAIALGMALVFASFSIAGACFIYFSWRKQRAAAAALTKQEELFRTLVEAAPDAMVICNGSGMIIRANQKSELLFGHPRDELLDKPIEILIPERYRPRHGGLRAGFIASPTQQILANPSGELSALRKDGVEIPVSITLSRINTEEGPIVVAAVRDITDRKEIEDALRRSNDVFQAIQMAILESIFLVDPESVVIAANPTAAARLNLEGAAIVGRSLFELLPPEVAAVRRAALGAVFETRTKQVIEDCDGDRAYSNTYYPVLSRDGRCDAVVIMSTDITEVKRAGEALRISEAKLRENMQQLNTILDNSSVGISFIRNRTLVWANKRMTELFGYSLEEMTGRSTRMFYESQEAYDRLGEKSYVVLAERRRYVSEQTMRCRDGGPIWVRMSGAAISDDHLSGGSIWVFEDIGAQKETEAELRRAKEAADTASRAKSEFLANMSHEIRTPINAILGLAHVLSRSPLNGDQRDCLQKLSGSGKLLLTIINDILDYSKIEAGRLELERAEFALPQILDALSTMMSSNAKSKSLELLIDVAEGVPERLVGDSLRLQQVLMNLASNALKFTESGEVVVRISVASREGEALVLRFEVKDTGIGIAPEALPGLFSSFTQADASTTRRFGGSGLGLAICDRLVRLMEGEIGVESEPGQGSTFWFTAGFTLGGSAPRRSCCLPGGLSVLAVDDNAVARAVIGETVQSLGWSCDCVASGPEALSRLGEHNIYDLILMDWRMPGMDGLDTIRNIRRLYRDDTMPVIAMITAFDREEVIRAGGSALVDGILVKPVTASMLYDFSARICEAATAVPAAETASDGGEGKSLGGLNLLLVEDNSINQEVARRILQLEGARVVIAGNGREAITRLQEAPAGFDLVLMDIQMPVMDGYEAARIIRADHRFAKLPIIALTAGVMKPDRVEAEAVGMNGFVPKPFDVGLLVSTVAEHCHRRCAPAAHPAVAASDALFDLEGALCRVGQDRPLLAGLLKRFERQFRAMPGELSDLVRAGSGAEAARLLHTLRGTAGSLALVRLSEWAGVLEDKLRLDATAMTADDVERLSALLQATLAETEMLTVGHVLPGTDAKAEGGEGVACQPLEALLREADISALDVFAEQRSALDARLGPTKAAALAEAMDRLDFRTALQLLTTGETDHDR